MISDNIFFRDHDKIKRIFKMLAKATDAHIENYYVNRITEYNCKGYDLVGSTCNVRDPRRHFLVKNNHYTVYEIPNKKNKGLRMTGKFLVLIYNIDFDYWYFCEMTHKFIKTQYNIITENVKYFCTGEFRISLAYGKFNWHCLVGGNSCCRGFRSGVFDNDNVRKELGYHTTYKVINKHFGNKNV